MRRPVTASHSLRVPSQPPESTWAPSGENATDKTVKTLPKCPMIGTTSIFGCCSAVTATATADNMSRAEPKHTVLVREHLRDHIHAPPILPPILRCSASEDGACCLL